MTFARVRWRWLVFAGVFIAALSMRSPIVAPTPVMDRIATDFGLDTATAGLLTTAPILMFALVTPLAASVIRRRGPETAVFLMLSGVLVGSMLRALPGFGWTLTGMVVIGAAITIGNVVMPVIIRRDAPPGRVATLTAGYTAMLNAGSLLTSLFTAPLADAIGWPLALLSWSVLTIAGLSLWSIHARAHRARLAHDAAALAAEREAVTSATGSIRVAGPTESRSPLRRPLTWILMATFALQSASYYALTTWLPTIAAEELGANATTAGAMSSVFQGVAILGAFLVPVLMRWLPLPAAVGVIGACWVTVTLGMAVAPQHMVLWMVVGAIAQAGGFVAIFSLLVTATHSDAEAAMMSATVQGGGYVFAALGAPVTGLLHDLSGSWALPLWTLVGATVGFAVLLVTAAVIVRRR